MCDNNDYNKLDIINLLNQTNKPNEKRKSRIFTIEEIKDNGINMKHLTIKEEYKTSPTPREDSPDKGCFCCNIFKKTKIDDNKGTLVNGHNKGIIGNNNTTSSTTTINPNIGVNVK